MIQRNGRLTLQLNQLRQRKLKRKWFEKSYVTPKSSEHVTDDLDQLLGKHDLHRTLRVFAWILRFLNNCKTEEKERGALTTQEIENARLWWIKRVQQDTDMEKDWEQLNMQENLQGLIVYNGRIQGHDPIYLPNNHLFTEKLVQETHLRTLHGGLD